MFTITLCVADNAALSTNKRFVSYMYMSCKSCLTSNHTPTTYLGRTGQTYLSTHHCAFTNLAIMSHLNQIVQFHTLVNNGLSHRRTVNTGVGTNLYVVLYHYDTYLGNLIVTFGIRSKSKSVCTYHAPCVYCNIISHFTPLIDGYMWI